MDAKVNVKRGEYELVPLSKISVGERCRSTFEGLQELASSIEHFGLDNPLTVVPDTASLDRYVLVAGERRLRALVLLGASVVPVQVRKKLPETEQKLLELEENLQRNKLSWQEQVEGMRQLDMLQRGLADEAGEAGWTLKDTAEKLGVSQTTASKKIAFAQKLVDRPELRKEIERLPLRAAIRRVARIEEAEKISREGVVVKGHIRCGDSRELLRDVASGSVALVLTDPPFGIEELAKGSQGDGKSCSYKGTLSAADNSTPEEVEKLLGWLMPEVARVLVPGGHFYVFYCQQLYGVLREVTLAAGLEVQEYPVIWPKGRTTSPGRGYLYPPCTEPILFGWKPPRKRMLERTVATLLPEVKPVAVAKRKHPFQKPVGLLSILIKQSTLLGEVVLDPFAGSGATVVAALRLHRVAVGFELSKQHAAIASKRVERELVGLGQEGDEQG